MLRPTRFAPYHDDGDTVVLYDTAADAQSLVRRPREISDNASPAGNSAAAKSLIAMAAVSGRSDWRLLADRILAELTPLLQQQPQFAGWGLQGLLLAEAGPLEVAVVQGLKAETDEDLRKMLGAVERYSSGSAVSVSSVGEVRDEIPLLSGRSAADVAAAYVCQNFACQLPANSVAALTTQLTEPSG